MQYICQESSNIHYLVMSFNVKFDSNLPHLQFFPMVMMLFLLCTVTNFHKKKTLKFLVCLFYFQSLQNYLSCSYHATGVQRGIKPSFFVFSFKLPLSDRAGLVAFLCRPLSTVLYKHHSVNDSCESRDSLNQPVGCLVDLTLSLICDIFLCFFCLHIHICMCIYRIQDVLLLHLLMVRELRKCTGHKYFFQYLHYQYLIYIEINLSKVWGQ